MSELPDFLKELNPDQLKAAQTIYGPVLIQAGAGSGKTKTVIARIMNMIANGINPANILAITFTNKAATELKDRITKTGDPHTNAVTACTIHHLCLSILMKYPYQDPYIPEIVHSRKFNIIDNSDQQRIVRSCRDDFLTLDTRNQPFDEPTIDAIKKYDIRKLITYINDYKQYYILRMFQIGNPKFSIKPEDQSLAFYIQAIIRKYIEYTAKNNRIDFDDMLYNALYLLKNNPQALAELKNHYQYISVDEYQDTSAIQEEIINLIADTPANNLCVVGDPNQSIYAFRGADISNILQFPKKHPKAKIITLATNYRSTQPILNFANEGISKNPNPYNSQIKLQAVRDQGIKPAIFAANDRYDQAKTVVNMINEKLQNTDIEPKDIAVLYRNNRSGLEMQTVLTEYGIPFETVANQNLYSHATIKDLLAYLSLINNHNDDDAFLRIVNTPSRGIGTTTIQLLRSIKEQLPNQSLFEIANHLHELKDKGWNIPDRVIKNLSRFNDLINHFPILENITLMTVLKFILDKGGYGPYIQALDQKNGNENNQEWIDSFQLLANKFDLDHANQSLNQRLSEFSNMIQLNELQDKSKDNLNAVHLSTIHAAKGLEYGTVFIIDMVNNILPSKRAIDAMNNYRHPNSKAYEEERRLFYVAVTRAKNELYISYPKTIRDYQQNILSQLPSAFIENLNTDSYRKMKSLGSERSFNN